MYKVSIRKPKRRPFFALFDGKCECRERTFDAIPVLIKSVRLVFLQSVLHPF